jgi:hypothetical protein
MSKAEMTPEDRRTARRYRVPGSARVFWGGEGAPVTISDVSAGGCLVRGVLLPEVGTRVFLSLDIGGLPNVRLPAITVRRKVEGGEDMAAVRFEVPVSSTGGLDKLLAQHVHQQSNGLCVLVVDRDERSRERIEHAVRETGAHVLAIDGSEKALRCARELRANVVLARADIEGLAALSALSREYPSAFRVAFGRKSALDSALSMGIAQAAADDPCSAKCLNELLRRGPTRTPV